MFYAVIAHARDWLKVLCCFCCVCVLLSGGCTWIGPNSGRNRAIENNSERNAAFEEGRQLFDAGQFQQAIAAWERVLPSAPQYVDAQLGIRNARLRIEQIQQDTRIAEATRSKVDAAVAEAEQLEAQGDLSAAVRKYEEARQRDPQNITLYNKIEELYALLDDSLERSAMLGDLYLSQGDYDKSQAEWERLLRLDPDNAKAQQRLADIEVLTATSDTVFLKRGVSLLEKGLIRSAREEFEKARRVNPANAQTETYLSKLDALEVSEYRVNAGDTLSSIAAKLSGDAANFPILADFNGLDPEAPLPIGQVITIPHVLDFAPDGNPGLLDGDDEPRQTASSRAMSLDEPPAADTAIDHEELVRDGIAAFDNGNYRQAIELLQQVLLDDPDNEEAYNYFVQATDYVRRGSSQVAPSATVSAASRAAADAGAPLPAQEEEDSDGKEAAETPELSEAERLKTEAAALREAGEFKQALRLFERIYQLDPSTPGILEAMDDIRDALQQQITAYLNEGIKHFNQDALEEAIASWNKVLELDPANRQASEYKERAETLLQTLSSQ